MRVCVNRLTGSDRPEALAGPVCPDVLYKGLVVPVGTALRAGGPVFWFASAFRVRQRLIEGGLLASEPWLRAGDGSRTCLYFKSSETGEEGVAGYATGTTSSAQRPATPAVVAEE